MKAIADLKYHPNLHARSLAEGYEVIVANTLYRPEQLAASVRMMIGRRVAGLALIVSEMDEGIVQELTEGQMPVVLYDV